MSSEKALLMGGFTGEYDPDLHGSQIRKAYIHLDWVNVMQTAGNTNWSIDVRIIAVGRP